METALIITLILIIFSIACFLCYRYGRITEALELTKEIPINSYYWKKMRKETWIAGYKEGYRVGKTEAEEVY